MSNPALSDAPATTNSPNHKKLQAWLTTGIGLGIASAIGYTLTNVALRAVGTRPDFGWACWVSMHKASTPALLAWMFCLRQYLKGLPAFPHRELLPGMILTGLVMQFGGNIPFQLALTRVGLAISVPLAFSTIILSGAWLSKIILKETLTLRAYFSMAFVILAIGLLNMGAGNVTKSILGFDSWATTVTGVAAACGSGLGYGFCGVMIRLAVARGAPFYAPVLVISNVGVVVLGALAVLSLGTQEILAIPAQSTFFMWLAGVLNAVSFFMNCAAFQRLPVLKVNLLNATQAAMSAIAGVLLFREEPTVYLVLGTLLTVVGLMILGWSDKPSSNS